MKNNKTVIAIMLIILIIGIIGVGAAQAGVFYAIGNDDANISFERLGKSNIYDLKYNVSTTKEPLFEISNGVDYMMLKAYGKPFIMYSDVAKKTILQGDVYTEEGRILTDAEGITINLKLEKYTLIIVDGLIVKIKEE